MYKARLDAMGRMVRTRVARLRVTKMYLNKNFCNYQRVNSRHHCPSMIDCPYHQIQRFKQNYFCRLVRKYHWLA